MTVECYKQQLVLAKEARTGRPGTPESPFASLPAHGPMGLPPSYEGREQNPLMAFVSFCLCVFVVWEASSWTRLCQTPTLQGWLSSHL